MGCEPILNLAATPDETVSIICTVVNKTILLTLWGKLMYVSYTTDQRSRVAEWLGGGESSKRSRVRTLRKRRN